MEEDLPTSQTDDEALDSYEVPVVEDIDSSFGPTVTAAGGPSQVTLAAPRNP